MDFNLEEVIGVMPVHPRTRAHWERDPVAATQALLAYIYAGGSLWLLGGDHRLFKTFAIGRDVAALKSLTPDQQAAILQPSVTAWWAGFHGDHAPLPLAETA